MTGSADVIVLGSGISGLVSASVLLSQGAGSVVVVDSYERAGGNHLDHHVGGYTFDVGSLIFQDDSPLLSHFPELLPRYLEIDPTWSRLNPQGKVTTYPFSTTDDILGAGPLETARLLGSAALARAKGRRPHNARDFAEHWLGPRFVQRSGLANYMERFCGVPADLIDLEFARSRMMWIAEHAQVRNLSKRMLAGLQRVPPPPRHNRQLARPQEGFAHLYSAAVESLERRGVTFVLGVKLESLRHDDDGSFLLETSGGRVRAQRVVSTIPLDIAVDLCGLRTSEPALPTVTLTSLFYSFSGNRGFSSSVLYNFSHEGTWKRLTMYSDFYGRANDRQYFGVEVVTSREPQTVTEAADDFRAHTAGNGLFTGDLALEGSHVLPHAYPVYTRGSGEHARDTIAALRAFGIESLGRQGGFQYQPTARHSTLEAEAALSKPTPKADT